MTPAQIAAAIADYRALRDGTLSALVHEIKLARTLGEMPPELEARAKLAEAELHRRERIASGQSVRERIADDLWDLAIARNPEITVDELLAIRIDAYKQMRFL